jgi:hypothetical protein
VQAIARRGDGRVINVSPLWTLQCLSSGPDQMLRQPALTAKRTMTRAGDIKAALTEAPRLENDRPGARKKWKISNLVRCGHVFGLERCGAHDRGP